MNCLKISCLLLIISCVFGSCKNPDETLPVINSFTINGLDDGHLLAIAGEEVTFGIEMQDDKQLKQVMLKLATMSGSHTQGLTENDSIPFLQSLSFGEYDTTLIRNVGGTNHIEYFTLTLPDSLSGGWHLTLGVLDDNGNYTDKELVLHIHNSDIPVIALSSVFPTPLQNGTIQLSNPEALTDFRLTGFMVDHTGLDTLNAKLYKGASTHWQNQWIFENDEWNFDLENIVIDNPASSGTYTFEIETKDIEGWVSVYRGTIKVP